MTYFMNGHSITPSSTSYGRWCIRFGDGNSMEFFYTLKEAKAWASANTPKSIKP